MHHRVRCIALACLLLAAQAGHADELARNFANPPDSARPRAWWHWMNGNVSKDGIRADLAWMHRVGIRGVQMFDADIGTAQYVDQRVGFMTPIWLDHVRYAVEEAGRLGLEFTMTPTSGWSETGGPWVQPHEAMKKYVWAETRVDGPRRFSGKLEAPPAATGPFQGMPYHSHADNLPMPNGSPGAKPYARPELAARQWYADAAVVAYRLPDGEEAIVPTAAGSSSGKLQAALLVDREYAQPQRLAIPAEGRAWIELDYGRTVRTQAINVALGAGLVPNGFLAASDDGKTWRTLAHLPGVAHNGLTVSPPVRTFAFPETRARYFRLELEAPARAMLDDIMGKPRATHHLVTEFAVLSGAQVNRFEHKAGFGLAPEYDTLATPPVAADLAVRGASVVDLTSRLRPDGSLDWDVPAGRWAILRLGYSLTGQTNDPSSQEGKGLEVDKLSARHVRAHMDQFMAPLKGKLGGLVGPKGLSHLLLDSWEANQQNWTDDMLAQFRRLRGYDPLPWLPVLGGRVVDSAEASDRFLFDFRRTIADLLTEHHYQAISDYAHQLGMQTYGEAVGVNFPTMGDGLQAKGRTDIPMGEFWDRHPGQKPEASHVADVREAASAAHIYGKTVVAAEAFTATPAMAPWSRSPRDLKWLVDYNLALGINRFVFHTSVHQPFEDRKPGVSLWIFGQNFTRHETWAEQAGPWVDYLSRASYLMQQGQAVNDVAVFIGEGAPALAPFHEELRPAIPAGYGFDYVNYEVLAERMTVQDGRLVLPGGASYALLVVPDTVRRMSPALLRKLHALVQAGAHVVAPRPEGAPGLADDAQYAALAGQLWGAADGRTVTANSVGKGRMYWGRSVAQVLEEIKLAPDVQFSLPQPDSVFVSAHRRAGPADIFFVANQQQRAEQVTVSLRAGGRVPELFDATTGKVHPAVYREEQGRTLVDLALEPHGSIFVVLRAATGTSAAPLRERSAGAVKAPWTLQFPGDASPAPAALGSWTTLPARRYFSGQASYRSSFTAPPRQANQRLLLDLGRVDVIAQVLVNGKPAGTLWRPPYRADVTDLVRPGRNTLEVKVTNLWANRLIGDASPDGGAATSFTTIKPYQPGAALLPSGLSGPVTLLIQEPGQR